MIYLQIARFFFIESGYHRSKARFRMNFAICKTADYIYMYWLVVARKIGLRKRHNFIYIAKREKENEELRSPQCIHYTHIINIYSVTVWVFGLYQFFRIEVFRREVETDTVGFFYIAKKSCYFFFTCILHSLNRIGFFNKLLNVNIWLISILCFSHQYL